ncbi:hypothetical protein [Nonomuraea sp. NPDC046570]|uniref:hypothetical protein n=1 Tax=Nonomuraea sp. NPDC046570 TaxID=3155255 RepID=UPI0033CFF950
MLTITSSYVYSDKSSVVAVRIEDDYWAVSDQPSLILNGGEAFRRIWEIEMPFWRDSYPFGHPTP